MIIDIHDDTPMRPTYEVYNDDERYGENYDFKDDAGNTSNGEELDLDHGQLKQLASAHLKNRKAKPDFGTKNESFVQVFKDLKRLGVKRNTFHLALFDDELRGVDPYSPILPLEVKIRIQLECIINPWYWLREICRIPQDGKPIVVGGGSPFLLDRNSVATWYLFLNGIDHYASKPRQCGKTQDALAKFNYAYHFGSAASTMLFFNKDAGMSRTNLYRLKCQRDMMPTYLQMRIGFGEDGKLVKETDNVTTMRNPINMNIIKTQPKANSSDMATKLGRGDTASLHYYDEFDFEPFNTTILDSSVFSYSEASKNAKANGALYCRVFTSTPGDADSRDGKTANEYISKMLPWKEKYFDMDINELRKVVTSKAYNSVVFVEHTWKQLKKSMEWYETQCNRVGYKQEIILREIELQRISGSSNSPFSRETLIYLKNNTREPKQEIDISPTLSPILFYENINPEYPYIFSLDPAQGLAEDRSAFTLINPYTQKIAAEFRSPYIPFPALLRMVVRFLDEYAPRSMIVVENNRGHELLQMLEETKYKFQVWYDQDKLGSLEVERYNKYGVQQRDAMIRKAAGFSTTSKTRPMLFNILNNFIEERIDDLYSKYINEEISQLVRKANGRIEHGDGQHDDTLFSYLIGLCVYYNATNLEDYGIIRGAREPVINGQESPEEMAHKMQMMMSKLPPEYKRIFMQAMGSDPIKESEKYAAQVQAASRRQSPSRNAPGNIDQEFVDPDSMAWKQMDEAIWQSNDMAKHHVYTETNKPNDVLSGYDMFGGYNIGGQRQSSGDYHQGGSGMSDLDEFFRNL